MPTCKTPSQVCMMAFFTGMVPSPDSIFVLNCPREILFGCLSNVCSVFSCGLNNLLSPHGAVFMYKWKLMPSFSLNLLSESDRSKIDLLASTTWYKISMSSNAMCKIITKFLYLIWNEISKNFKLLSSHLKNMGLKSLTTFEVWNNVYWAIKKKEIRY